jgi:hypothetical protein
LGSAAVLKRYCTTCHNGVMRRGGLLLDGLDVDQPRRNPETWEKVVRKVRTGMMPPSGAPRPDRATLDRFASVVEETLDHAAAAAPNPGAPVLHRLNRTEYANAVRDLLDRAELGAGRQLAAQRVVYSTAKLLREARDSRWLNQRRETMLTVTISGSPVDIRDQKPLYAAKMLLEGGWSFSDFVRHLNEHVFFWPGWHDKPIRHAQRHYDRYAADSPVILRARTQYLFDANKSARPLFCKYNSGSPRTTMGKGSPRGPNTFVECRAAGYGACDVAEVTFETSVRLPDSIESSDSPFGPWRAHRLT